MNESKYTEAKKGVGFAMVMLVALLLGLAAAQAMSAKPAEAGICVNCGGGSGLPDSPAIVQPNDNFSAATKLEWLRNVSLRLNTKRATLEPGEPTTHLLNSSDCADYGIKNSVWYSITPKYKGTVTFTTAGSKFDTVLRLFQGSSLTSLQQHSCRNSYHQAFTETLTTSVNAGETYYLQVSGTNASPWGQLQLNTKWGCYYTSSGLRLCPIS